MIEDDPAAGQEAHQGVILGEAALQALRGQAADQVCV
jgi:hypothetical protein